eukprot:NODE_3455_length_784_cov_256.427984.p2 GENE.NODE_3455_length_784_cov_256.427984~~NODE_3455_length_784_cov_256.427984.p2  ORF type:complete len:137 (+),score=39.99 NODE_3455_length_784_cov_256.427984:3-413(+)
MGRCDEAQPELEPDEEVGVQRERVEVTRALWEAATSCDQGAYDSAKHVVETMEAKVHSRRSKNHDAMMLELQDATARMRDRQSWEMGGRAEVLDCVQMHTTQRCTNSSDSSRFSKQSKSMYLNSSQVLKIASSRSC